MEHNLKLKCLKRDSENSNKSAKCQPKVNQPTDCTKTFHSTKRVNQSQ